MKAQWAYGWIFCALFLLVACDREPVSVKFSGVAPGQFKARSSNGPMSEAELQAHTLMSQEGMSLTDTSSTESPLRQSLLGATVRIFAEDLARRPSYKMDLELTVINPSETLPDLYCSHFQKSTMYNQSRWQMTQGWVEIPDIDIVGDMINRVRVRCVESDCADVIVLFEKVVDEKVVSMSPTILTLDRSTDQRGEMVYSPRSLSRFFLPLFPAAMARSNCITQVQGRDPGLGGIELKEDPIITPATQEEGVYLPPQDFYLPPQ